MDTWIIVLLVVVVVAAVLVAVAAKARSRARDAAGGIGLPPLGVLGAGEPVTGPEQAAEQEAEAPSVPADPAGRRS